jgi:hypothetical protein
MGEFARGIAIAAIVCAAVAPASAMTEEEERAKAHFLAGQSYYDQASYTDALREFTEAYRISKRPALLYNIARCHEAVENYPEAVKMLEAYLEADPTTSDRSAVEQRITNLKGRQAQARKPEPPPQPVAQPLAPQPQPSPPPEHRKRLYTWIVGGVGAAALLAALGTGVASQLQYGDLTSKCSGNVCDPTVVDNAQKRIDSGKRLALATDILWPIGAAAVATGVVLFFLEGRHPHKERASLVVPLVGPSLGGLAVAHDF